MALQQDDLSGWTPRVSPPRAALEGRYVRLEPLDPAVHGDELFALSSAETDEGRFRWLFETSPRDRAGFEQWLARSAASEDPLFFAVIDKATGRLGGRQTFMRIDRTFGVIEIGNILWTDVVARKPAATEALYLFAKQVFELGYRRFEWKCNDRNVPSKRAALRFGFTFEGVFRQHMVVKGENRDTAWFSMLDREWPTAGAAMEQWLSRDNFDSKGLQRRRLEEIRAGLSGQN